MNADLSEELSLVIDESEAEKAELVRCLHDDLGGLLVGAIMDLGWIQMQPGQSAAIRQKLARSSELIRSAVTLKRDLIEEIRPSLLENVGLYSTMRWHLKRKSQAVDAALSEQYSADEPNFDQQTKVAVFRIIQAALKHVLSDGNVSRLNFNASLEAGNLELTLSSEHSLRSHNAEAHQTRYRLLRHRSARLGGSLNWLSTPVGHTVRLRLPHAQVSS